MKRVTQSVLSLAMLMMASSVMAQGLTGYYQSLGLSGGSTSNVGLSSYGSSNTYTPNYNNYNFSAPSTNYNSVGSNTFSANYSNTGSTGGLSAYYANNGITTSPGNSATSGGFTQYFSQNLQANTFTRSCPVDNMPDPSTCQGGQYQRITDNYGCTVEWRCEGGQFCPQVQRPLDSQCNGVWEPQYSASTQCLTHYFCDRTPDACTEEYQPVCGDLNGNYINYSNNCFLTQAGANFVNNGQCQSPSPVPNKLVINSFTGPHTLEVGQTGTWKVNATASRNTNISYSIDWGETTYASQAMMRPRPVQTTTFTHEYAQAGTYQVRVTATDEYGKSASATTTVRVDSQNYGAPTISSFTGPHTLEVGQTGTWSVIATDPADAPVEFSINWGEMMNYSTANNKEDLLWGSSQTFQHAYSQPGTYQVTVSATGSGGTTSKTLSVQVNQPQTTNLAPVVHGITGPTSLNVNQTGTWRVRASDPQNQDLMYQINWGDQASYGAQARYSADAGFVQNSAFTHQYSQPGTYTVSITVMNSAGKTAQTTTTVRVSEEPVYQPYVSPTPDYSNNNTDYDYYQNRYNQYQNNGSRHSFFNRSYNWR